MYIYTPNMEKHEEICKGFMEKGTNRLHILTITAIYYLDQKAKINIAKK